MPMSVSGILVLGRPGTGKSTSLRNLDPKTTVICTPNSKPLPFPGSARLYTEGNNRFTTSSLTQLKTLLDLMEEKKPDTKTIVIEDFSHYFSARTLSVEFKNADTWGRWSDYARDINAVIKQATESLKVESVIILHHTDLDNAGMEKFASSGNLVDKEIKPSSHFTYVLHSQVLEGDEGENQYVFQTNAANKREAKTPMGLFEDLYVPNDLAEIIKTIKTYETGEAIETYETNEA